MELFRPVNATEYREIAEQGFRGFPPRDYSQPIFTALLSEEGATQIARHLRIAKKTDNRSYVVGFIVDDVYIRQFPIQHAHDLTRRALWIPAEDVEILNQHLIGEIRVLSSYQIDREDSEVFFA